jgi:glycosyltransferase involved in cell wall biosynthesis
VISVVTPVYRNAATVEALHRRVVASLREWGEPQLVFVDDACPAGSGELLDRLSRDHREVQVLHLSRNAGQHRAALAGLALSRGEWTVVMDADLQDPPEAIPGLLHAAQEGYDAIFAGRRGRYESAGKLLTSRLFKRAVAFTCNAPVDAGMFVALNRTAVDSLLAMDGPPPHLPAMIGRAGLRVTSVPVDRAPREQGHSAYTSRRRLLLAASALRWGLWRRFSVPRRSP